MTRRLHDTGPRRKRLDMQLISSRTIPFLDSQSLVPGEAREVLFRSANGNFVLYLANGGPAQTSEERVLFLGLREALVWLNEPSEQRGSFWT